MINLLFLLLMFGMTCGTPHPPTVGDISQPFGNHVGVDYSVTVGTEVYSVMNGVVIQVVQDSEVYGRYVIILQCDGYASLYAHLSRIVVTWGEVVSAGQVIAYSGGDPYDSIDGDGQSTGWHLHWEVRPLEHLDSNKYNVDPLVYLDAKQDYTNRDEYNFQSYIYHEKR